MLAEVIHSVADFANQVLCFLLAEVVHSVAFSFHLKCYMATKESCEFN